MSLACVLDVDDGIANDGGDSTDGPTPGTSTSGPGSTSPDASDTTGGDSSESGDEPTSAGFDLGPPDGGDLCGVQELDGLPPPCSDHAPPETFDTPTLEWSFDHGLRHNARSWTTPLVANLTDDNGDGSIDLCDVPDVVLVAETDQSVCSMYILDGASGQLHAETPDVNCDATPALGDIDGDGGVEIVTMTGGTGPVSYETHLQAFDHDGTKLWQDDTAYTAFRGGYAGTGIGLADLDGNGSTEILLEFSIHDANGELLWLVPELEGMPTVMIGAPFGADLDADGDQEYVSGTGIYDLEPDADGTWAEVLGGIGYVPPIPGEGSLFAPPRLAHVADLLPVHPGPEVFFTSGTGYFLWAADGSFPWGEAWVVPEGIDCDFSYAGNWGRPASIHDFDGDGEPEIAVAACGTFMLLDVTEAGPVPLWTTAVDDDSGISGSTAFDFLNDGTPEPIYSDESTAWVWTATGEGHWETRMGLARRSGTILEYPVVADVDNDGSAEILVVSHDPRVPALQVFGTENEDWVQPRRIWNQHAYSVTNVLEDGTIPAHPVPNWEVLDTFRTNSPIDEMGLCVPAG